MKYKEVYNLFQWLLKHIKKIKISNLLIIIWNFIKKVRIDILLTIIWVLLSYLSFSIALPFYQEYKNNNDIPNLNWNWSINFITKETTYKKYEGMNIEYNMFLLWNMNKYVWKWEKIKIWDTELEWNQRDRTEMDLIIEWNNIYWIYYLYWKERNTDGNFKLTLSNDWKSFSWTFVWNAADSKWIVTWLKNN